MDLDTFNIDVDINNYDEKTMYEFLDLNPDQDYYSIKTKVGLKVENIKNNEKLSDDAKKKLSNLVHAMMSKLFKIKEDR